MKKFITFMLAVLLTLPAMQMQASEEKGLTVSIGFGLSHYDKSFYSDYTGSRISDKHTGMIVVPRVGYRLSPEWEVGGLLKYENIRYEKYGGIGAYGDYTFANINKANLRFFVRATSVFYFCDFEPSYGEGYDPSHLDIGLTPGVAYRIPGSPVDLKLTYLFIGFNNNDRWYKEFAGCLGRGNWIIDAGLRRLEIGASVHF